jgi:hypothetical protein
MGSENRLLPPPPLQITELDSASPTGGTPFTPFALPTPTFQHLDFGVATPVSPMGGFQMNSGLQSLGSPATQQTPFGFFSPGTYKTDDADTFK